MQWWQEILAHFFPSVDSDHAVANITSGFYTHQVETTHSFAAYADHWTLPVLTTYYTTKKYQQILKDGYFIIMFSENNELKSEINY
jgi:hypothetical protein